MVESYTRKRERPSETPRQDGLSKKIRFHSNSQTRKSSNSGFQMDIEAEGEDHEVEALLNDFQVILQEQQLVEHLDNLNNVMVALDFFNLYCTRNNFEYVELMEFQNQVTNFIQEVIDTISLNGLNGLNGGLKGGCFYNKKDFHTEKVAFARAIQRSESNHDFLKPLKKHYKSTLLDDLNNYHFLPLSAKEFRDNELLQYLHNNKKPGEWDLFIAGLKYLKEKCPSDFSQLEIVKCLSTQGKSTFFPENVPVKDGGNIFELGDYKPITEEDKKEEDEEDEEDEEEEKGEGNGGKYFYIKPDIRIPITEIYQPSQVVSNIRDNPISTKKLIPFFKTPHANQNANIYSNEEIKKFTDNIHDIVTAANLLDPAKSSAVYENNFNCNHLLDSTDLQKKKLGVIQHLMNINGHYSSGIINAFCDTLDTVSKMFNSKCQTVKVPETKCKEDVQKLKEKLLAIDNSISQLNSSNIHEKLPVYSHKDIQRNPNHYPVYLESNAENKYEYVVVKFQNIKDPLRIPFDCFTIRHIMEYVVTGNITKHKNADKGRHIKNTLNQYSKYIFDGIDASSYLAKNKENIQKQIVLSFKARGDGNQIIFKRLLNDYFEKHFATQYFDLFRNSFIGTTDKNTYTQAILTNHSESKIYCVKGGTGFRPTNNLRLRYNEFFSTKRFQQLIQNSANRGFSQFEYSFYDDSQLEKKNVSYEQDLMIEEVHGGVTLVLNLPKENNIVLRTIVQYLVNILGEKIELGKINSGRELSTQESEAVVKNLKTRLDRFLKKASPTNIRGVDDFLLFLIQVRDGQEIIQEMDEYSTGDFTKLNNFSKLSYLLTVKITEIVEILKTVENLSLEKKAMKIEDGKPQLLTCYEIVKEYFSLLDKLTQNYISKIPEKKTFITNYLNLSSAQLQRLNSIEKNIQETRDGFEKLFLDHFRPNTETRAPRGAKEQPHQRENVTEQLIDLKTTLNEKIEALNAFVDYSTKPKVNAQDFKTIQNIFLDTQMEDFQQESIEMTKKMGKLITLLKNPRLVKKYGPDVINLNEKMNALKSYNEKILKLKQPVVKLEEDVKREENRIRGINEKQHSKMMKKKPENMAMEIKSELGNVVKYFQDIHSKFIGLDSGVNRRNKLSKQFSVKKGGRTRKKKKLSKRYTRRRLK